MLFARITGSLDWACPTCNTMHKTRIDPKFKALECWRCEHVFIPGIVLYERPMGPTLIPRDTLMIAEGFSLRRLVNRVYCDLCAIELVPKILRKMAESNSDQIPPHALKKP